MSGKRDLQVEERLVAAWMALTSIGLMAGGITPFVEDLGGESLNGLLKLLGGYLILLGVFAMAAATSFRGEGPRSIRRS